MPWKSVEAIAFVIQRYESKDWQWGQGHRDGICLALAVSKAHAILRTKASQTMSYIGYAMREKQSLPRQPDVTFLAYADPNIILFNDAEGRTLDEILAVLRKAKRFAEADAAQRA